MLYGESKVIYTMGSIYFFHDVIWDQHVVSMNSRYGAFELVVHVSVQQFYDDDKRFYLFWEISDKFIGIHTYSGTLRACIY